MSRFSAVAKAGLLALAGALAFLLASRWAGVSADAIAGLAGAVVGATIAAAIQFAVSRTEQLDRYRLAAVEKRLQAHQEAFALWRKLLSNVHRREEIGTVVTECQDWWNRNCLYLEERARTAFRIAYMSALDHKHYLEDRSNPGLVKKNWADIVAAGDALAAAVALPSVGDLVKEVERDVHRNDA
jgi:uncharacterized membrane protein YeaQ/YmgE (transglycosylase-associated protein family)